jgi:ferrous iron transport protein B
MISLGSPKGKAGASHRSQPRYVVLTGNPNCGKTTVFNELTGLRAKVGNYAGVTVERKEGKLIGAPAELQARVLDLPGTYSLSPQSMDEQVSRDVLLNRLPELPSPSVVVVVADASNLQRNLYYVTQVLELGYPTVLALNMMDVAEANGHQIDHQLLSTLLDAPVVPVVASSGRGIPELRRKIIELIEKPSTSTPKFLCEYSETLRGEANKIARVLASDAETAERLAGAEALLILTNEKALASSLKHYPESVGTAVQESRRRLEGQGVDWRGGAIEARYQCIARIQEQVTTETRPQGETTSDRIDRVLTHKVWGTVIFLGLMALLFQSIFTFARLPMDAMQAGIDLLAGFVGTLLPPGDLNSLLVDGVIAGVGAVVVFLPQILLLFLFIGFLEDTGHMARAAFLMDRLMSKVGLHGKSFIPMISSFACAIPGIMATRTIESPKDRLATILVCPLMSCSARLPVYTLLIAACIPDVPVAGILKLQGLTMLGMYLLGVLGALFMAWVFKKTLLRGEPPLLILELPPYKRPLVKTVMRHMWDRSKIFLKQAGTVILGVNILLWFLATYPKSDSEKQAYESRRAEIQAAAGAGLEGASTAGQEEGTSKLPVRREPGDITVPSPHSATLAASTNALSVQEQLAALANQEAGAQLRNSFAGRLGRLIEPAIAPLGFDWKIGIGLVASFAAREVFVSTMSTVYNVGQAEVGDAEAPGLVQTLRSQKRPNGQPVYTALTGLTLMVFYVFALQCVSTIAVVKRETNTWRWPLFQWLYLAVLAWVGAWLMLQVGKLAGLG